jgi:putative salt-induced outer membrane protein YdiY
LSIGAGPGFVYEQFTSQPSTYSPAVAWFVGWHQDMVRGTVTLFHNHHGIRDLIFPNATRLEAQQGIRVKVYGRIALNFEYDVRFNTTLAPGRHSVDTALIFGLSYGFERTSPRGFLVDLHSRRE